MSTREVRGGYTTKIWLKEEGRQVVLRDPLTGQPEIFPTRTAAKKARQRYYLRPKTTTATLTVADLRDRWLEDAGRMTQHPWRDSTRVNNAAQTSEFARVHGARYARDIRLAVTGPWVTAHPSQHKCLRAMFAYALAVDEGMERNPFANIRTPAPLTRHERVALSEEQVARLAGTAGVVHGQWHASMILFAAYTGLRAGELFALTFDDLDGEAGTVNVWRAFESHAGCFGPPKNGRARLVAYGPQAREAVRLLARRPGQEFVFEQPVAVGRHWQSGSYHRYWEPVRVAAGMPDLVFHSCRHTAGSWLLANGASLELAALQLGHTDRKGMPNVALMRSTYGHVLEDTQARMLAELQAVYGAAGRPVAVPLRVVEGAGEAMGA